jgi:Uma2 family endonuclease
MSTIIRPPGRLRFSVDEFARMQDAGLFEGRHVELLDGELFEVTKNPPHNAAVAALGDALRAILPRGAFSVREEKSIEPWADWWPEPDIAVVRGIAADYFERHPGPADVVLLVEVCDTSEEDRTKKLAGYAAAGFPVYWILDLGLRQLEVYRDPGPSGYSTEEVIAEEGLVALPIAGPPCSGGPIGTIAVAELLPRAEGGES